MLCQLLPNAAPAAPIPQPCGAGQEKELKLGPAHVLDWNMCVLVEKYMLLLILLTDFLRRSLLPTWSISRNSLKQEVI